MNEPTENLAELEALLVENMGHTVYAATEDQPAECHDECPACCITDLVANHAREAVDRERAAWATKVEALANRAITLKHGWAGDHAEFVSLIDLRGLLAVDDTEAKP